MTSSANLPKYDYEKSVSLFYSNDSHRGPGKVVQNLKLGLEKIGMNIHQFYESRPWKYSACLQFNKHDLNDLLFYAESKRPILMGPNLFVLPNDNPMLCELFNDFVVPSEWVRNLYQKFELMKHKNIYVWPVGIDTNEWIEKNEVNKPNDSTIDCFIYFKNRSEQDLAVVEAICRKFGLKYKILKYGFYEEEELKNLCNLAKFAILLTGTESQGIAYMQILSTNTPCYVFNATSWVSEDKTITASASSVPYFDNRCGYITNDVDLQHFDKFIQNISFFEPRKYIIENHTLEKSALEYYRFLQISHGDFPNE